MVRRWLHIPCVSWWLFAGVACLPPARMELSGSQGDYSNPSQGLWWAVEDANGIHDPIVVVEQPIGPGQVRQWIVDDRGVRIFLHDGQGAHAESPPLVSDRMGGEFGVVISLVRSRFGRPNDPGWPGGPLPADQVNAMRSPADLVDLLEALWSARRMPAPAHLSHHQVREALGSGRFTVSDLLKAGL
jgi:hypothetical protein